MFVTDFTEGGKVEGSYKKGQLRQEKTDQSILS
jgi:hypothetical protein